MKKLFVLLVLVFFSGCYRFHVNRSVAGLEPREIRQNFFLFGFLGSQEVDLAKECPRGVAAFEDKFEPLDVVLAIFSVGIYTPKTVVVECAA